MAYTVVILGYCANHADKSQDSPCTSLKCAPKSAAFTSLLLNIPRTSFFGASSLPSRVTIFLVSDIRVNTFILAILIACNLFRLLGRTQSIRRTPSSHDTQAERNAEEQLSRQRKTRRPVLGEPSKL